MSASVKKLQSLLRIAADGMFGPQTEAAVKNFQSSKGLPASGVVDAATWKSLRSRSTASPVRSPGTDPTMTWAARTSRAHRASFNLSTFVNSDAGRLIVRRESRGICHIVSSNGLYAGKWQMNADFWSYYGGLKYATSANRATCTQQNRVAFKGWVDRWWQPWSTAP